jgi:hypothetical protein
MDKIIADAKTPADLKDRCQKIRAQVCRFDIFIGRRLLLFERYHT